jgi:hypothetical protein
MVRERRATPLKGKCILVRYAMMALGARAIRRCQARPRGTVSAHSEGVGGVEGVVPPEFKKVAKNFFVSIIPPTSPPTNQKKMAKSGIPG